MVEEEQSHGTEVVADTRGPTLTQTLPPRLLLLVGTNIVDDKQGMRSYMRKGSLNYLAIVCRMGNMEQLYGTDFRKHLPKKRHFIAVFQFHMRIFGKQRM